MLPTRAVRRQLGNLLAADTTTLANATANKIALIVGDFVPDENLNVSDLTFATFTGSTPKSGTAGAQEVGNQPQTGDQVITILSPAGGWRWECSATPVSPQTITGYALLDSTLTTLLAMEALNPLITISNVGDFIDLGALELTFVIQPIS